MSNVINILGNKYGKLTVVEFAGVDHHQKSLWKCVCECGGSKIVHAKELKLGNVKSCGCLWRQDVKGLSTSKLYRVYANIKQRCVDPNHEFYHRYGGRGITMSDDWMDSFLNFYRDMGDRPEGMTVERIDNDKGYCKENCRWATRKEQANNTKNNTILYLKGERLTLSQASDKTGILVHTILDRLKKGMSTELALTLPRQKPGRKNPQL